MRRIQILLFILLLVLSGCAGGNRLDSSGVRVAWLSGSIRNTPENVRAFASTRVYAFVGTDDTIVKPEATREFVSALIGAGYDAKLTELPETDHFGVPSQAYLGDYGLVDWLEGK